MPCTAVTIGLRHLLASAKTTIVPSLKSQFSAVGPKNFGICKYPPAEPGALGIGPLEAATLDPKLYLFGRRTKYSLPTSPRPFIQIFLRHFGEQMPLDNCVATWWG